MGLGFGLVGAGLAGPLFAGAFAARPRDATLRAVASRREDALGAFADRYDIPHRYTDWRDLVADPSVDVVCIATPTGHHPEMAIAAARAGKHVLTEKPMATTLTDADRMIASCAEAGVTLGVIFMYRFMDSTRKMKQAVDNGLIGRPILGDCVGKFRRDQSYYDSGEWRGTWAAEGGGSLMTQTSHTLDLLLWMLGPVETVSGAYTVTPTHQIERPKICWRERSASAPARSAASSAPARSPRRRSGR